MLAIADSTGHLECEKRIKGLYLAILHRQPEKEGFVWHLNNCKKHGYTYKMSFGSINNSKERKDILCRELIDHLYKVVFCFHNSQFSKHHTQGFLLSPNRQD